ncbi:MAG: hypothetical protein ABSE18_03250 [Minisyncoccia bacterium]|jgi:hypothetical protein
MKRLLWVATALVAICVFIQAPVVGQTDNVTIAPQAPVAEHQLLEAKIDEKLLLPGEKQCSFFLLTTFGGRLKPGIRFQFLDNGPPKKIKVEIVPVTKIRVIIDEQKSLPTAEKVENDNGEFIWLLRLSTKTYEPCKDCLPEPTKPPASPQK